MADVLQALSDPVRLRLMGLLPSREAQPNASHHLKVLRSAGLIRCQRKGGYAFYHVNRDVLQGTLSYLDSQILSRIPEDLEEV
jgi:ArsR family transcriptional regulator